MIESADKEYYGFEYKDCDGKVYKQRVEKSEVTWHEVLEDYLAFLGGIYGYDIKSQVRVQAPVWYSPGAFAESGWNGEFFVKEADDENSSDTGLSGKAGCTD
jgi:hypothetical protein